MTAMTEQERFETWALANGFRTELRDDVESPDTYFRYETEQRWIVWQAATATTQPVAAPEPTQQEHVMPPFAAPAGQLRITRLDLLSLIHSQFHRAYASAIDREEIDTKYMAEIEDALRAVYAEAELVSRFRAQGGNTSPESTLAAPVQAATDEVRDAALEEVAQEIDSYADSNLEGAQLEQAITFVKLIRALKRTTSTDGEKGGAA